MFGGVGIYAGPVFFALIADDTLYFKVDDSNRADFVSRGMGPFRPYGEEGETMQYYEVPPELLEDAEALRAWAERARAAAAAKKAKRPKGNADSLPPCISLTNVRDMQGIARCGASIAR